MRWLSTRLRPLPYQRPARQKSHYSLGKRLRYLLSRLFGTRLLKSQSLYFVTINGQRFKRLILRDSYLAAQIERNLEYFRASPHFPPLLTRYENEIWVEFIEGTPIRAVDEGVVEKIAEFYAAVYSGWSYCADVAETLFPGRLQQNLRFLHQTGVLSEEAYRGLEAAAARLRPRQVWVGFDYTDPQLQNFVITPDSGRICAVDVESLRDEQLMGVGVARACEKWLEPFREVFFAHLARAGVPDFRAYFPFVELSFLAARTKRGFFQKKWKNVDPTLFDRFRHL